MPDRPTLPDPRPHRGTPLFALTPLADVIFQLLVFFMLTAGMASYASVSLGQGRPDDAGQETPTAIGGTAAWHVGAGTIRSGSATIEIADLPVALEALQGVEIGEVLLFITPEATVQDLADVLALMEAGGIQEVRLVGRPDAMGLE